MKIRHWATSCALLIGLPSGPSTVAAAIGDQPPTLLQSAGSATCNRASDAQLAEIQGFFSTIKSQLGSISDPQAVDAGHIAAESIQSALSSGCLDPIAKGFTDLRNRPLGSSDAAYQIWTAASQVLSNIARSQGAPDRVEAIDIASAKDVTSRWQRPPAEAADFYFSALGAHLGAGYANKDPKSFDRALAIARERIVPLADKQATPEIWFRVHFLIGDMLSGKTNMLEPGETTGDLAKQSIAATQLALLGKAPHDDMLFMAHMDLALAYYMASSSAGFVDKSLNEGTVAAAGKILSDPRMTPDLAAWGYLHDAYAKTTIIVSWPMGNPERARRMKDALTVAEQGLAKLDRDRYLLFWARLQIDRAFAAREIAADQPDKAEALRNLDLAIASFEAILAAKEQVTSSGGKDVVATAQSSYPEALKNRALLASTAARPKR